MLKPKFAFAMITALCASFGAHAQQQSVAEANKGRVGIMTGSATGTYVKVGGDLTKTLDGERGLRVVTMVGKGSVQNIEDLIYFKFTDAALVQSDVLELLRRKKADGIEVQRLDYIAKIYDEELHLVVRKGASIRTLGDLSGKRVNMGGKGSGSAITSGLLTSLLGLEVKKRQKSNDQALAGLFDGSIDAMFFVQKKPASLLRNLSEEEKRKVEIISINITDAMRVAYTEAAFTASDYPGLIDAKPVETIAVPAILAVYNNFAVGGDRYNNLENFSYELVQHLEDLKRKYPGRWADTDLNDTVPGWNRFPPMANALAGLPAPPKKTLFD